MRRRPIWESCSERSEGELAREATSDDRATTLYGDLDVKSETVPQPTPPLRILCVSWRAPAVQPGGTSAYSFSSQ